MDVKEDRFKILAKQYDVVVIGGGIYGSTMAWEAVSRGLKTLLVERADFASQTSANSLKTIHGGLRYLQDLDLKRLRESASERAILQSIAPHLVAPLECLMPTYQGITRSRFVMQCGLFAYRLLSMGSDKFLPAWQRPPHGSTMSRKGLKELLPDFISKGVTGGASWYDAQAHNTERLVLSFIMSAVQSGAQALNYTEATELDTQSGKVVGIGLHDCLTGLEHHVKTKSVIDCTGPWRLGSKWCGTKKQTNSLPTERLRAWNLVLKRPLARVAVGFRSAVDDGSRLLFAAPWKNGTIIGTWYDQAELGKGPPTKNAVLKGLTEVNAVFPDLDYSLSDVTRIHTGWLPASRSPEQRSELILESKPVISHAYINGGPEGLVLVQGVKYTTARDVAEKMVSKLKNWCKFNHLKSSVSHQVRLYGANYGDFMHYVADLDLKNKGQYTTKTLRHLVQNYGDLTDEILASASKHPELAQLIPGQDTAICAELDFVIKNEFTYTLSDLLLRRTDLGSLECPSNDVIEYCADQLGKALCWSKEERLKNITDFYATYPSWMQL